MLLVAAHVVVILLVAARVVVMLLVAAHVVVILLVARSSDLAGGTEQWLDR